jgi:hypothetical protein
VSFLIPYLASLIKTEEEDRGGRVSARLLAQHATRAFHLAFHSRIDALFADPSIFEDFANGLLSITAAPIELAGFPTGRISETKRSLLPDPRGIFDAAASNLSSLLRLGADHPGKLQLRFADVFVRKDLREEAATYFRSWMMSCGAESFKETFGPSLGAYLSQPLNLLDDTQPQMTPHILAHIEELRGFMGAVDDCAVTLLFESIHTVIVENIFNWFTSPTSVSALLSVYIYFLPFMTASGLWKVTKHCFPLSRLFDQRPSRNMAQTSPRDAQDFASTFLDYCFVNSHAFFDNSHFAATILKLVSLPGGLADKARGVLERFAKEKAWVNRAEDEMDDGEGLSDDSRETMAWSDVSEYESV